ncbi:MAG: glycosyltransferase [Balneolaceae bacterium]|nr:MAG: glycosyltransferase [Balneolaceae bacterium]
MKTILATAYAINPLKGSEDGMGWNFVMQISRFNKVIAVTRENNRPHIETYMQDNPSDHYKNITFLYFDTPYWTRFWKKGGRGAMLYYLLWQRMVVSFIREKNIDFDIVHNLNFHNDWSPSHLWKLEKPFVWGPIGHHPLIPSAYLEPYSKKYLIKDRLTWLIKKLFWNFSGALQNTVKRAGYIWAMNPSVKDVIDIGQNEHIISASVATQDFGWDEQAETGSFSLMSVGRLVPLKGFDLTIRSFALFVKSLPAPERAGVHLKIIGSGPEEAFLKKITEDEGISDCVTFISWIDRSDVMKLFRTASAFLFPSHEGAGMVVPEALSFGVPVITLDNEGPGGFITPECGIAVKRGSYEDTVQQLAGSIGTLYQNPSLIQKKRKAARKHFMDYFHWDRRGEQLKSIYANL